MDKDKVNQHFVDYHYNEYLQKRFGINACSRKKDRVILFNQVVVSAAYQDISSPVLADRLLMNDCKRLVAAIPLDLSVFDYYYDPTYSSESTIPNAPIVVIPPLLSIPPIEVIVGTPEAIAAGIIVGHLTIINDDYAGKWVEVFRNNINLPSINPGDGNGYFTKVLISTIITLSTPLADTEIIKIKVIA